MNFSNLDWALIGEATIDTLLMTGISLGFTAIIGLPLGVLLFLTSRKQMLDNAWVYQTLSLIVNILRSVPFLILLIVIIPLTRILAGTSLGVQGAIPPLVLSAAPFFARLVENVLRELDPGVNEACRAMGANSRQTVLLALLPEATTGIVAALIVTAIALVGYSAMSGVIGGGGLGDLALRFGYQRYQTDVMVVTVAILVVLVQLLQVFGDAMVARLSRK
ncbi:ABC transporter permease [Alcaligenes ammonioxydans]|jgi:D-methionine transport system permease protein|uniref:ABC transporter permease n=1 Tax=Alcaligenes ammonioxydans TaxID=2582914 RepID=A0ABX8SSX1_9BURK|nr:methionine ABC transporter permease [Alcaligenes ammonioxydans]EJC61653.1 binding-protein-dependent transport system inner membrane protein [Alcaligenes faecalis subsp. faecalis NCIB 8687]QBH20187.1 ABC transporter permease [Alcaligenes faecalis]MCH1879388.1 ABC transporter permease [Alcaligenes ammonioxydans]QXX78222.1 ABC transporter permease [Alcaligenes ammonioxydans]WGQ36362.1 ABC transporter permease [Alcaligenes faecalis]